MPIETLRDRITAVDAQIVKLLHERRELAKGVATYKHSTQKPIRDIPREASLLENLVSQGLALGLDSHYITRIFHLIIADSINLQQFALQQLENEHLQHRRRVAYLGNPGTYSFLAARHFFVLDSDNTDFIGCKNFESIIADVESKRCEFGILPIENTTSGGITETYDLLAHAKLFIVGEINYPIEHCLVAKETINISSIEVLYTHPEILNQCSQFIQTLGCEVIYESSSSSALQAAKADSTRIAAALGSEEAAGLYGLKVLKRKLANNLENYSRFVIVAREPLAVAPSLTCKTSLILATVNEPGALVDCLSLFKAQNINLCKLESRPLANRPWEELFYLDIEGSSEDAAVAKVLSELKNQARLVRILGTYPVYIDDNTPIDPEYLRKVSQKSIANLLQNQGIESKHQTLQLGTSTLDLKDCFCLDVSALIDQNALRQQISLAKNQGFEAIIYRPPKSPEDTLAAKENSQLACEVAHQCDLPIILEATSKKDFLLYAPVCDGFLFSGVEQDSPNLIATLGYSTTPVLVLRSAEQSIQEWLATAQAIAAYGNQQVILYDILNSEITPQRATFFNPDKVISLTDFAQLQAKIAWPLLLGVPKHSSIKQNQDSESLTLGLKAIGCGFQAAIVDFE